jgi:hypothetical protein
MKNHPKRAKLIYCMMVYCFMVTILFSHFESLFYCLFYDDGLFTSIVSLSFSERVGAKVVECACVIELPELKV